MEPKSRPLQFHSKTRRKDNIYKTPNTVGSHTALWSVGMAFTYNNSVQIFCATALDGPTWVGRSFVEMTSATVQPTQSSTEGIGNYYTAQKGSFNLASIIGHWTSYLLWCINYSLRRSCVYTTIFRRNSSHKDVDSKDQSCTNKEFVRSPVGTLCSTSWSKFGGSGIIIFERSTFPDTKSVRLDRFNGNTGLAARLSKKVEDIRCQLCGKNSESYSIQQLEFRADGGESCWLRITRNLSRKPSQTQPLVEWTQLARKKRRLMDEDGINWGTSACSEQRSARRNTEAKNNGCYSGEQLNSSANSSNILFFGKLVRIFCYVKKFIQKAKQQSQKTIASRTDPTKSDTKCYSQKRNLSSKRCQQKKSEAAIASEFRSLQLSSSDLYFGRIAIYSLIQKLYLQEFDAIVSQSSSSMTEEKGNNISENVYCHKPLGKVELGKVGEVEVGKVEVGKVKVGKVGQGEVSKVGKVEVGKAGRVEVGKFGKVQVGKLCTAQIGILDKPTRFNDLEQHVGTSEEEMINSTRKRRIKLLPKKGRLFKLSPIYDPDNKFCSPGRTTSEFAKQHRQEVSYPYSQRFTNHSASDSGSSCKELTWNPTVNIVLSSTNNLHTRRTISR